MLLYSVCNYEILPTLTIWKNEPDFRLKKQLQIEKDSPYIPVK